MEFPRQLIQDLVARGIAEVESEVNLLGWDRLPMLLTMNLVSHEDYGPDRAMTELQVKQLPVPDEVMAADALLGLAAMADLFLEEEEDIAVKPLLRYAADEGFVAAVFCAEAWSRMHMSAAEVERATQDHESWEREGIEVRNLYAIDRLGHFHSFQRVRVTDSTSYRTTRPGQGGQVFGGPIARSLRDLVAGIGRRLAPGTVDLLAVRDSVRDDDIPGGNDFNRRDADDDAGDPGGGTVQNEPGA